LFFSSRLRTIIAALHCNILVRKDDLVRNLDYAANVLEAAHQDETRYVLSRIIIHLVDSLTYQLFGLSESPYIISQAKAAAHSSSTYSSVSA